ncbi:hypothetical protein [Paraburkholderia sp.]|uniref:hypothetical protein n=1 Tax=Paraburkholderia sp. TaxID=1926495 RepID=UPI003D7013CE
MQLIALCFLGVWLYSVFSMAYLPIKVAAMKRNSQDIWAFLSRRRLLLSALAYLVAAPLLGLLVTMASVAGASGGNGSPGISDSVETAAWALSFVFLAAAAVALVLAFNRPKLGEGKSTS